MLCERLARLEGSHHEAVIEQPKHFDRKRRWPAEEQHLPTSEIDSSPMVKKVCLDDINDSFHQKVQWMIETNRSKKIPSKKMEQKAISTNNHLTPRPSPTTEREDDRWVETMCHLFFSVHFSLCRCVRIEEDERSGLFLFSLFVFVLVTLSWIVTSFICSLDCHFIFPLCSWLSLSLSTSLISIVPIHMSSKYFFSFNVDQIASAYEEDACFNSSLSSFTFDLF